MDELIARWENNPGLHVYHFGAYEPSALKRLTGRYATRADALDRLLRAERFVDLYAVVTQGLRIGVESYSLKQLEPIYDFERETPLAEAGRALRQVEAALELGRPLDADAELRRVVASYNRDDCRSTLHLRDWLEARREEAVLLGDDLPRPVAETGEASEKLTEWQNRVRPVVDGLRQAEWVVEQGIDADGAHRAARDLLLRLPPRGCAAQESGFALPGEDSVTTARRLVRALDAGVLPIQGPPGAGKTYTGARMIVELARRGKKVGLTAVSHKVIDNLLKAAVKAAEEEGFGLRALQKVSEGVAVAEEGAAIRQTTKNEEVEAALRDGEVQVAAGTAWLWARSEMAGAVDVLFVDEAGQMSLAGVLAVSPAARSLVLLGDPQQLEQPIQATHPEGTAVAALSHLLAGKPTLEADRGLFLDQTRRLPPEICAFTSEQFYDGKLHSFEGLERQTLHAPPPFDRSGLFYLPVEHQGNQSYSLEEAEVVEDLLKGWFAAGAAWTDSKGNRSPLSPHDVLVVVPYNAQIGRLQDRLPEGVRVGTVDKFQGQEAPVVLYSMVSSSPEDAPRGLEFLYSRNRLNVATSRARCACVLVASERLLEPECRTPRQMRLANALCRYVEMATWFTLPRPRTPVPGSPAMR